MNRQQAAEPFSQWFWGGVSSENLAEQKEINQLACRVGIPKTSDGEALEEEEEVAAFVKKLSYRQIYHVFQLHLFETSRGSLFLIAGDVTDLKFIPYFGSSFNHLKSGQSGKELSDAPERL